MMACAGQRHEGGHKISNDEADDSEVELTAYGVLCDDLRGLN